MLLKWFAPILSFTTEEIFQIINQGKNKSIHLETFPDIPSKWENKKLFEKWNELKIIRNVANAAIVDKFLKLVKDVNLAEFFITSNVIAKPFIDGDKFFKLENVNNIKVLVKKAKGKKCSRCWKILKSPCEKNNCGLKN